jgi:hypothetical protein
MRAPITRAGPFLQGLGRRQGARAGQLFAERAVVDRRLAARQLHRGRERCTVARAVEVGRLDQVEQLADNVAALQDRADAVLLLLVTLVNAALTAWQLWLGLAAVPQ